MSGPALPGAYGGPWQEFRALLATVLFSAAMTAHAKATVDLAANVTDLNAGRVSDKLYGGSE